SLYRWRGLAGIVAGAFLILLVSYAALFHMMIWRGADPTIAGFLTVFGAIASIVHWLARPHLVSIAMMVGWYAAVESYRRHRTRWIWIGPLLIVCWANLHGAFVITFVVLVIYALGEWLEFAFDHRWWDQEIKRVLVTYLSVGAISALTSLA